MPLKSARLETVGAAREAGRSHGASAGPPPEPPGRDDDGPGASRARGNGYHLPRPLATRPAHPLIRPAQYFRRI